MSKKYNEYFGGGKIPSEIKSQSKSHKNLIHDHAKNVSQLILCTMIGILIGTTPVAAGVKDNLSGSIKQLLGSREATTDSSGYNMAPANAKINYLEKRIENLQNKTEVLKQIIDAK